MRTTLSNHSKVAATIPVAAIATDTTTDGTGVSVGAFGSAMAVVFVGTVTDGAFEVALEDSDDDSTYTAVADAFLQGTEPTLDDGDSDTVVVLGYKGTRNYLRVSVTSTDTTEGGVLGALIVCAGPGRSPVVT